MQSTLARLPIGGRAQIVSIGGERGFRRRLLELGFLPGVSLVLVGRAPMGDPLDVRLRGCRYSLRAAEAEEIVVEEISASDGATRPPETRA